MLGRGASSLTILAALHVSPPSLDERNMISRSSKAGVDGSLVGGRRARGLGLPCQVTYRASVTGSTARSWRRLKLNPTLPGSMSWGADHVRPWSIDRR